MSTRFLLCKVITFPLVCPVLCDTKYIWYIPKEYVWGKYLETVQISYFSSYFCQLNCSIPQWFSPETSTMVFTKWWFSTSSIPTIFFGWHSTVRKSFPTSPCISLFNWFIQLFISLWSHRFWFYSMIYNLWLSLFILLPQLSPTCSFGLSLTCLHLFFFFFLSFPQGLFCLPSTRCSKLACAFPSPVISRFPKESWPY